jgi:hypothetical protein
MGVVRRISLAGRGAGRSDRAGVLTWNRTQKVKVHRVIVPKS